MKTLERRVIEIKEKLHENVINVEHTQKLSLLFPKVKEKFSFLQNEK